MFNKTTYIQQLEQNTANYLDTLATLDESTLNKKVANHWSILEIAEHIYKVERIVVLGFNSKSEVYHDSAEIFGDKKLGRIIIDLRSKKVASPKAFEPSGIFASKQIAIDKFTAMRMAWVKDLIGDKIIIDNRKVPHPYLGDMTISDWLYFIIHHSQRHYLQMEDIVKKG